MHGHAIGIKRVVKKVNKQQKASFSLNYQNQEKNLCLYSQGKGRSMWTISKKYNSDTHFDIKYQAWKVANALIMFFAWPKNVHLDF